MEYHVIALIFFFNDTATTEIYTLSLHDALPIQAPPSGAVDPARPAHYLPVWGVRAGGGGPGVTGHPGLGGPEHRAGRGGVRHRRPSHPVEPDRHRAVVPRPRGCPGRAGIRHRVASSRRRRGEVLGGTLEVAAGRRRGRRG